ncbi:MAG: hypothetical protein R6X20_04610 [Phycisphaerae bacterium]
MSERPIGESVAASLSLSLFSSQLVMEVSAFVSTGAKPDSLRILCEVAKRIFSSGEEGPEGETEGVDQLPVGLLPTPEHLRLIPEAISGIGEDPQDWSRFVEALAKDLDTIAKAPNADPDPVREAASRVERFFDALGDVAIDHSRDAIATKPEDEEATWRIPSLIG